MCLIVNFIYRVYFYVWKVTCLHPGQSMWDLRWTKWPWDRLLSSLIFLCQYHSIVALHTHIIWEINNKPVGGCSSETYSHPINMNKRVCVYFLMN
jgi:uncharacterized membrane protein